MIELLAEPVVQGLGATGAGALAAFAAIRTHLIYILRDIKKHDERLERIEKVLFIPKSS